MRIIREGNLRKAKQVRQFVCYICDCIFEADNTEYKYDGNQHDGMYYKVTCPCCNTELNIAS